MKRNIPELKLNDIIATVLQQFVIYASMKNVSETHGEDQAWKRGYACALLDTRHICKVDWDRLIDAINHPEKEEA